MDSDTTNSLTIEEFRLKPIQFFKLDESEQTALLVAVCGPLEYIIFTAQRWQDSPYRVIELMEADIDPHFRKNARILGYRLRDAMKSRDWTLLAALLIFFRVAYSAQLYSMCGQIFRVELSNFFKVFQYGCFENPFADPPRGNVPRSWLIRHPNASLIKHFLKDSTADIPDSLFEAICIKTFEDGISCVIVGHMELVIRKGFKIAPRRTQILIGIISQRRLLLDFKPSDSPFRDPFDRAYLFLLYSVKIPVKSRPEGYNFVMEVTGSDVFRGRELILEPLNIPRPVWSRSSHGVLSIPPFQKEVLLVLCMYRFRREQFNFHKDLLDMLLGFLFEAQMDRLELNVKVYKTYRNCRARKRGEIYKMFDREDVKAFDDASVYDAACLCHGMKMPPGRASYHKGNNTPIGKIMRYSLD
jgi:hypothetical protein